MRKRSLMRAAGTMVLAAATLAAPGQSLWTKRATGEANAAAAMRRVISVNVQDTPAKNVFEHVARLGGLNLVADWRRLEQAGIDTEQPINLIVRRVTVARALRVALMQMGESRQLLIETHSSYAHLLTRRQANEQSVVKIYLIGDLLHRAPHFTEAPQFDLSKIAGDANASGFFQREASADETGTTTRRERGEQFADLIRRTIEPDIWELNGGTSGRITYHEGRLIVRAPRYVHDQIGLSETDRFLRRRAAVRLTAPRVGVVNRGAGFSGSEAVSRSGLYVTINGRMSRADVRAVRTHRLYSTHRRLAPLTGYNIHDPNSYYNQPSGSGVAGIGQ